MLRLFIFVFIETDMKSQLYILLKKQEFSINHFGDMPARTNEKTSNKNIISHSTANDRKQNVIKIHLHLKLSKS